MRERERENEKKKRKASFIFNSTYHLQRLDVSLPPTTAGKNFFCFITTNVFKMANCGKSCGILNNYEEPYPREHSLG